MSEDPNNKGGWLSEDPNYRDGWLAQAKFYWRQFNEQPPLLWWTLILMAVGLVGKGITEGLVNKKMDMRLSHGAASHPSLIYCVYAQILGVLCVVIGCAGIGLSVYRLTHWKGAKSAPLDPPSAEN